MKAKIALVTNKKLHHKYWISSMMKHNNVVAIIHPTASQRNKKIILSQEKSIWFVLLKIITKLYYILSKNNSRKEFREESEKWFADSEKDYKKIDKKLIYEVNTVNSTEAINIIKNCEVDVICFLGGDIAKADFINSPKKICLNFHSGLSPIYNGTKSYLWPMIENRPNLVGGTLMRMNERIDGGDLISQFLPEINNEDNASSLFMKTVKGSVTLFTNAINKTELNQKINMVRQERSIRYTKSSDFSLIHEIQLQRFYNSGKISRYIRDTDIIEAEENEEILINKLLQKTLKK